MKKIISTTLSLFATILCLGQSTSALTDYNKAKKIISDLDSIVTPNGIQENFIAKIGNIKQWVYVRGQNKDNPIILFVHGGPASPMAPTSWVFQKPMEEYFTIVHYDQRAAGKTFVENDTLNLSKTITIDHYVDDAIEIAEYIKRKYDKQKLILIGHSWGTIISMKAALKRPDLFYAYIGIGQVINVIDNEKVSFDFALKTAIEKNNDTAIKELSSIAPYPGNEPLTRERIIIERKWAQYFGGLSAYRDNSYYYFAAPRLSPLYTLKDIEGIDNGNIFTLSKILPEFFKVDFKNIKSFPIPIFMFMGRHDYSTPSEPTAAWLKTLKAPLKKGIWFENSSHLIPFEEPGKMLMTLISEVGILIKPKKTKR